MAAGGVVPVAAASSGGGAMLRTPVADGGNVPLGKAGIPCGAGEIASGATGAPSVAVGPVNDGPESGVSDGPVAEPDAGYGSGGGVNDGAPRLLLGPDELAANGSGPPGVNEGLAFAKSTFGASNDGPESTLFRDNET
jgi:hypothetical protein